MTNDLVERVAGSLYSKYLEIKADCAPHPSVFSKPHWETLARAAVAECFRWRPIETAPKDGTHVLVCFDEPKYGPYWTFQQRPPTVAHWFGPADLPGLRSGGWYLSVHQNDAERIYPTHWMPLPEPPKEKP